MKLHIIEVRMVIPALSLPASPPDRLAGLTTGLGEYESRASQACLPPDPPAPSLMRTSPGQWGRAIQGMAARMTSHGMRNGPFPHRPDIKPARWADRSGSGPRPPGPDKTGYQPRPDGRGRGR